VGNAVFSQEVLPRQSKERQYKDNRAQISHGQIQAKGAASADRFFAQILEVISGAVKIARAPPSSLLPGLGKGKRLLIVYNGIGYIMHPFTRKHTLCAELVVLRDRPGVPAPYFLQEGEGHHKSGAGDEAGQAQGLPAGIINPVNDPEIDGEAGGHGIVAGILTVFEALGNR
jgi:hypothetical protein